MSAVRARQEGQMKIRHHEIEWQTKHLAMYIVSGIDMQEQDRKKTLAGIDRLSIMDPDKETSQTSSADTSGEERSIEDIMLNGNTEEALRKNSTRTGGMPFGM